MAVTASFTVHKRLWGGYDERQFPTALWVAAGRIEGDGTGGLATFIAVFNPASAVKVNEWYSLEQITMFDGESGNREISIIASNFDSDVLGVKAWRIQLQTAGASSAIPIELSAIGVFLGNQRSANTQLDVQLAKANVAFNWDLVLEGYVWGPRSLSAPGGFQRPTTGLYGARR